MSNPRRPLRAALAAAPLLPLLLPAVAAAQDLDPRAPTLVAPQLRTAEPPPYPEGAEGEARVVVSLVIDAEGSVVEAEVAESGGEAFDEAVLEHARTLRFDPATSNGEAISARIRLAFTFAPPRPLPPPEVPVEVAPGPEEGPEESLDVVEPPPEPVYDTGTLAGQVFLRGTRDVLADVRIEAAGELTFVDEDGRFELRLPEGMTEVLVVGEGYRPLRTAVQIEAGMRLEMAFRLDRERGSRPFETVIHGRRDAEEVTRISLTGEEIHNLPGTMGDPFRAIEALPGVTPLITGLPYYLVRGAPPSGTGFYLDGIRVPGLFHFALGPAVLHPSLVDRIDFFPGGAPAELGRYVGGMVRAETRLPGTDRWRSEWDLRLTDVGALVEVPIGDEVRIAASGRYSYSAWLIQLFEPTAYLQYWDYQARVEWEPSSRHRLVLFGFGSFDEAGSIEEDGSIEGPRIQFHRVDLRYVYRHGGDFRAEVAGWFGVDETKIEEEGEGDMRMFAGGPRARLDWSPYPWLDVAAGTDVEVRYFPPPAFDPEDDLSWILRERDAVLVGAWAKATFRPTDRTDVEVGARLDVDRVDYLADTWVDLRLSVRHQLADFLWLKGSAGTFHQPQSFFIDVPGIGSFAIDSEPQSSFQISQGVEIALPWELGLDVQFYYTAFESISEPDMSFFDEGPVGPDDDPRDEDPSSWFEPLDGRAYGLEILLRRRLGESLFGWIAYTVGRAERDYRAGTAASDFDQTHVLNFVLSWDIGWGWRVGGKFHLRSGRPYTPVDCIDDPSSLFHGDCIHTGAVNSARLPPFYRLDLRVDKKWTFETWWFALYFEFINVTFTPEPFAMECDCTSDPKVQLREIPYIVIPTLGIRGVY